MIELHDKAILAAPGAAVSMWLFAHGDDSPQTIATVRYALQQAMNSGKDAPLHYWLGIPRDGGRWRIHCRNEFLRRAAMLSPARYTSERQIASHMQKTAPEFIAETAPAWMHLGIPTAARDFDRLLCLAYLTGIEPPGSLREWQRIVAGCDASRTSASQRIAIIFSPHENASPLTKRKDSP